MAKPTVIIVGADKGGVGKTMLSRCLLDLFKSKGIEHRAFDTETPAGVLKRFYPAVTEIVDLTDSDGQMRVFDTLGPAVTVIDIRAGLLTDTMRLLAEIGFLDGARCSIVVLHVLGNTKSSIDEVQAITASLAGARYVPIGNRINGSKFDFPAEALDIPMLDPKACEAVDGASASFFDFINGQASAVLRGKVRHWLGLVHAQFDKAQIGV